MKIGWPLWASVLRHAMVSSNEENNLSLRMSGQQIVTYVSKKLLKNTCWLTGGKLWATKAMQSYCLCIAYYSWRHQNKNKFTWLGFLAERRTSFSEGKQLQWPTGVVGTVRMGIRNFYHPICERYSNFRSKARSRDEVWYNTLKFIYNLNFNNTCSRKELGWPMLLSCDHAWDSNHTAYISSYRATLRVTACVGCFLEHWLKVSFHVCCEADIQANPYRVCGKLMFLHTMHADSTFLKFLPLQLVDHLFLLCSQLGLVITKYKQIITF